MTTKAELKQQIADLRVTLGEQAMTITALREENQAVTKAYDAEIRKLVAAARVGVPVSYESMQAMSETARIDTLIQRVEWLELPWWRRVIANWRSR